MRSSQYSNLRPQTFGQLLFIHEMQQLFLLSLTFLVGKVFPLLHIRNIYASAHYTPSFPLEKYNHNNIMLSKRNTKPLLDSKDNSNIASTVENKLKEEENMEKNLSNSYIVLGILLLTFASNQWSRQAMYYLSDFSSGSVDAFRYMNRDLDFSKEMYAALASFGFTAVFATVSLFSGDVSDRYSRNRVTTISCLVWSLATALQAYATKFSDLVPLRAIIGASQAFYNPAAYTLLADIFPARMVGSVNGIFSGGIYLGGALASLSIVLDGVIGWRNTLLVIGGLGLLASALCFIIVPEPREEASQKPLSATSAPPSSLAADPKKISNLAEFSKDAISALFEVLSPYQAKLLLSAATLRFCAGFSIGIWKAPFIFDKFPGNEVAFSGSNAVIMTVGGLASTFLGGYLSDVLSNPKSKDIKPRARSWIPAIGRFCKCLFIFDVNLDAFQFSGCTSFCWLRSCELSREYSALPFGRVFGS